MPKARKRNRKMIVIVIIVLLAAAVVLFFAGYRLQTTRYTVKTLGLPAGVDSYRVVHLSDLHGARFGAGQEKLVAAVAAQEPDLIVMTGDMIDRMDTSVEPMRELLEGIVHLAPIFAVNGNHEADNPVLHIQLKALYEEYGVDLLENAMREIKLGGTSIYIGGVEDGRFWRAIPPGNTLLPTPTAGSISILLYHETNQYDNIVNSALGYRYLFSGHTHGGIIRLPFVGGVVDNDMKLFPQYDSGVFAEQNPVMISSRGLGDSSGVPIPRINNRPEVVCVVFEAL